MKKQDVIEFLTALNKGSTVGINKMMAKASGKTEGACSQWGDVVPFNSAWNIQQFYKGKKNAPKINQDDYINNGVAK